MNETIQIVFHIQLGGKFTFSVNSFEMHYALLILCKFIENNLTLAGFRADLVNVDGLLWGLYELCHNICHCHLYNALLNNLGRIHKCQISLFYQVNLN